MGGRLRVGLSRIERAARRHPLIAVPLAVFKKFGDDRGGHWAALVAYYGFFSLFPLLLAFTTILGFLVQGNDELRRWILDSALSQFPIIGDQIRDNLGALEGSLPALVIGLGGSIWAGMGVVLALQGAMDDLWDVPQRARPNFLKGRTRALLGLIALALSTMLSAGVAMLGATGGSLGGVLRILALAGTLTLNTAVAVAMFRYLTVAEVRWRQVLPGAVVAATGWMALLTLGGWLVDRQLREASELYGLFAIVLGLLSWITLGAQLLLLSAELNVVLARRRQAR